jgi:hypothetical protein
MSPVAVEVTSRTAFYGLDVRLWTRGLDEDTDDGVICRWPHRVAAWSFTPSPLIPASSAFEPVADRGAPSAIERGFHRDVIRAV